MACLLHPSHLVFPWLLPFDASCTRDPPGGCLIGPAPPAKSVNFQRTAEHRELPEAGRTLNEFIRRRHLDIANLFALHAHHVMMRFRVPIVARALMQRRYLARLAGLTELLEDAMHSSQRYVGKLFANRRADVLGAGMAFRGQQRLDDRETLRGDGQAAFMAALHEIIAPPSRIFDSPLCV